jgi:very-short-patch-repair endonuclease
MLRVDLMSELSMLGGTTDRATLIRLCGRAEVDRALREGKLVRLSRGRYAMAMAGDAERIAATVHGVVSHRNAAVLHGWGVKHLPSRPDVTLRRGRNLTPQQRALITPHWLDLHPRMVNTGRTIKAKTLVDCMRALPFDEALAIVDSALRETDFTPEGVAMLASMIKGRGARTAQRVAREATGKAANAFESVARAIALDIPGLHVQAQFPVRVNGSLTLHPDLADPALGIAIECEGFEWHGDSAQLVRDCERYNHLVLLGWTVIRFGWVHVIEQPGYVRRVITQLANQRPLVA